jgi:hypothetical protein
MAKDALDILPIAFTIDAVMKAVVHDDWRL